MSHTKNLIQHLQPLLPQMHAEANAQKINLLKSICLSEFRSGKLLLEYHHQLLFILGYCSDEELYALAYEELERVAELIKENYAHKWKLSLTNSGLSNTEIQSTYSFDALEKMNALYGNNISLLSIDADKEKTENILHTVLPSVIRNEWNNHHTPNSAAQVKKLAGKNSLTWLLNAFKNADVNEEARDHLFDSLEIFTKWRVEKGITLSRSTNRKLFFHSEELIRKVDLASILKDKKYRSYNLSEEEKISLGNTSLEILAGLLRETDPVTYAETPHTVLFDMGRGFDIALFSMKPSRRLALESYIGYVGYKNRVPITYGGAWICGDYARIGINIFPWFRGGESAWIFAQLMRNYHQEYGVQCFNVEPYQIGKGNSDGIKSGAFWFYYRMGYRPQQKELAQLAEKEFAKISADKKYRSSSSTLLQLANSRMLLQIGKSTSTHDSAYYSEIIKKFVTENFKGDFWLAQKISFAQMMKCWSVKEKFSSDEKKWFLQYSLLLAMIPGSAKWNATQRKTFIRMVKAKANGSEKEFTKLWQNIRFI